jgi:hypothetical protein
LGSDGCADAVEDGVDIADDLVIGDAKDAIPVHGEVCRPGLIVLSALLGAVYRAIDLDDQVMFGAVEVQDKRPYRVLAAKRQAVEPPVAQLIPQHPLRHGHMPSHPVRRLVRPARRPAHAPRRLQLWFHIDLRDAPAHPPLRT